MLLSRTRQTPVRRLVGGALAGLLAVSTLSVAALVSPAEAAITMPAADAVIRDAGPITISENRGGQYANIQAATTSDNFLARGCNGGNVNRPKADARITVTRVSDGVEVHNAFHQTSNNLFNLSAANATGAFSTTWDTTGAQPGLYRIKSIVNDRAKIGSASSQTCTPDTNVVLSDFTVEFRPWQHANFNDFLGHGNVRFNTNPRELQFTVDGSASPIIGASSQEMSFFASPETLSLLPSDPAACASDPLSCLPADVTACEPSAGCVPRFVVVNRKGDDALLGLFDISTGAFAASATTGGKSRLLVSAGSELDPTIADLLDESAANLEALTGIDLLALLSTTVEIRALAGSGQMQTYEIGVLRGLQITKSISVDGVYNGIDLKAPYIVNAGFLFFQRSAGLRPAGTQVEKLTVTKSPLVPNLPTLFSTPIGSGSADILAPIPVPAPVSDITGPLLLVGGGPLVNIYGDFPDGTGSYTAGNGGINGPNVDTHPNAPSGLPAWIPGFDSATMAVEGPIDFVGHAALYLELDPIDLGPFGVLDLGAYLLGQGVTVFGDSPLPTLGSLPLLWDTENPAAAQLNEITSGLALNLLTNPAVGSVLTAALSLLGGGTPDLDAVTGTLSDLGTFTSLIDAVTGAAGLDAVPGLEDAVNEVGVITDIVPEAPSGPSWNLGPILGPLLGL